MCTHSFTTEYEPAPSVFPVLYRHGWTFGFWPLGGCAAIANKTKCGMRDANCGGMGNSCDAEDE